MGKSRLKVMLLPDQQGRRVLEPAQADSLGSRDAAPLRKEGHGQGLPRAQLAGRVTG